MRASARARGCVRASVLRARAHICGCPSHPSGRFASHSTGSPVAQVRQAAEASGLWALFAALKLDPDLRDKSLVLAVEWLKRQGADTVAELCELAPGACDELVDRLGLPPIKAKKLREALAGTARTVSRARASGAREWWFSRTRRGMCDTGEAAKHAQAAKEARYPVPSSTLSQAWAI